MTVRADTGNMIYAVRNVYSVHSRLIGDQVEARMSADMVEVWYEGQRVEQLPRLRGRGKHQVDYHHPTSSTGRCASLARLPAIGTATSCSPPANSASFGIPCESCSRSKPTRGT